MKDKTNEPETLNVRWLSSCQMFQIFEQIYYIGIAKFLNSLTGTNEKLLQKLSLQSLKIAKTQEKRRYKNKRKIKKNIKKLIVMQKQEIMVNKIVEEILTSTKHIMPNPIVGAVAVKYDYGNVFSVFMGIAMNKDEQGDIDYIKRMGQRQPEDVARALFPQYNDMTYHK